MFEWNAPLTSSPPSRRFSSSSSANMLWKSQYTEPHGNIWNSCSSLQPSSSIWGPQVKPGSQSSHSSQQVAVPQLASPQMNLGKFGSVGGNSSQRRLSSVTSLGGSLNTMTSPLWFEDPYLVSPPPSPETISNNRNSPVSTSIKSPFLSPTFASESLSPSTTDEFIISPASGPLYFVKFKGDRVDVFTAPGTTVYYEGDLVMVDADRGRDLGTVTATNVSRRDAAALKQRQNEDRQNALHNNGCGNKTNNNNNHNDGVTGGPAVYNPKQILGIATSSEVSDMVAKINDEQAAIALCNKKAAERHLDMGIVDAEYQWDRRKLTFFYTANTRVDFRDLVRELFRIYKTRIWMCATTARS